VWRWRVVLSECPTGKGGGGGGDGIIFRPLLMEFMPMIDCLHDRFVFVVIAGGEKRDFGSIEWRRRRRRDGECGGGKDQRMVGR